MPWEERSIVSQRREAVSLMRKGLSAREVGRRFGVSATTALKWDERYDEKAADSGLSDRSRRPKCSPRRSSAAIEAAVVELRQEYPTWGARKLAKLLPEKGVEKVPSPSTIVGILRRHGLLDGPRAGQPRDWQRFEHEAPNDLWQMDFKGHFATSTVRCHPLTLLDDHSRYSLVLQACSDEVTETVRPLLQQAFRRYGLPRRILCDNGPPWGDTGQGSFTPLGVWLLRLGVDVVHGRPYHPQTQGKLERFHRTLKTELIGSRLIDDLAECQKLFDPWRELYNHRRPHDSLGLQTPASRYCASPRRFPESLPPFDYGEGALVRKIQAGGQITFLGRRLPVPKAFSGQCVVLRPTLIDGVFEIFFCHKRIKSVDLREKHHD